MKLSIIIPCYNEEDTIKPLLNSLFKIKFPIDREIIVVDDGSLINHKKFLKKEIESKEIKFIRLSKNRGKGVAIRIGLNTLRVISLLFKMQILNTFLQIFLDFYTQSLNVIQK